MNAMKTAVVARAYIKESADYMMTNSEMTMTGRRTFHRMQAEIFYIDIPSMRCLGKDILVDDPFGEKRPGETRAAYGDIGAAIGRRK